MTTFNFLRKKKTLFFFITLSPIVYRSYFVLISRIVLPWNERAEDKLANASNPPSILLGGKSRGEISASVFKDPNLLPRKEKAKESTSILSADAHEKAALIRKLLNQTYKESLYPAHHVTKYLMLNRNICRDVSNVDIIIIVHTKPNHFNKRQRIRETYANKTSFLPFQIRIVFLLGKTETDLETPLILEHLKHNDTIMGDFRDDYHNLTYKGVMGFHWVSEYCPNSNFVLKLDDDVVVDMHKLLTTYLSYMNGKQRSIFCNVWKHLVIDRDGKWKVPKNVFYNMKTYPYYFCSGFTVILTTDLIAPLYEAAKITPSFWIDDVYLFGMLPKVVGDVNFYDYSLRKIMAFRKTDAVDCWREHGHGCNMFSFVVDDLTFWPFWNKIQSLHKRPLNVYVRSYYVK